MNKNKSYYRGAAAYCRDTQLRQEATASANLPTDNKSGDEIEAMRETLRETVATLLERKRRVRT